MVVSKYEQGSFRHCYVCWLHISHNYVWSRIGCTKPVIAIFLLCVVHTAPFHRVRHRRSTKVVVRTLKEKKENN